MGQSIWTGLALSPVYSAFLLATIELDKQLFVGSVSPTFTAEANLSELHPQTAHAHNRVRLGRGQSLREPLRHGAQRVRKRGRLVPRCLGAPDRSAA
jgi:hypothetical protein